MRIPAPSPSNGVKLFMHGDGTMSVDYGMLPRMALDSASPANPDPQPGNALQRLMLFLQDKLMDDDLQTAAALISSLCDEGLSVNDNGGTAPQAAIVNSNPRVAMDARLRAIGVTLPKPKLTDAFYRRFPNAARARVV